MLFIIIYYVFYLYFSLRLFGSYSKRCVIDGVMYKSLYKARIQLNLMNALTPIFVILYCGDAAGLLNLCEAQPNEYPLSRHAYMQK